jgi:hypothetical protein
MHGLISNSSSKEHLHQQPAANNAFSETVIVERHIGFVQASQSAYI